MPSLGFHSHIPAPCHSFLSVFPPVQFLHHLCLMPSPLLLLGRQTPVLPPRLEPLLACAFCAFPLLPFLPV